MAVARDRQIWEGKQRRLVRGIASPYSMRFGYENELPGVWSALILRPYRERSSSYVGSTGLSRTSRSLAQWLSASDSREEALFRAHTESGLTMSALTKELGPSVSRVSRLIARAEEAKGKT